ncbi:MAG: hypothetical protein ABSE22_09770 [Xanthobacteraceae bacterium]|jgi:hypothetical protein
MAKSSKEPERPRVEPEILPPERDNGRGRGPNWPPPYGFTRARGTHRIYVSRMGPFGFALLMLVAGLLGGVLLLALIGAALIWIPVVAVLLIIAAISGVLRRL